jgi:hypothetical protein
LRQVVTSAIAASFAEEIAGPNAFFRFQIVRAVASLGMSYDRATPDTAPKIGEPFHTFRIAIRTYIVRDTAGFSWSSLPDLKCKMPCRGRNACGKSVEEAVVEQSMRYGEG